VYTWASVTKPAYKEDPMPNPAPKPPKRNATMDDFKNHMMLKKQTDAAALKAKQQAAAAAKAKEQERIRMERARQRIQQKRAVKQQAPKATSSPVVKTMLGAK